MFSSRVVIPRSGEPTSARTLSRCIRRLVFGDTDGGGRTGAFSFTAGVRGGSICEMSFLAGLRRRGDDEGGANIARPRLCVGLSYEEPRSRAISSSARPRLILGRSASEPIIRWGRRAEESKEEKYPLSSMEANLRLCERDLEDDGKRGTGGGVS